MGQLYIIATPIGNMEDITLRALKLLREVDLIAAEDTRHTKKLLTRYEISKPHISYFQGNEKERIGNLILRMKNGDKIALVSDAGTPAISDPGFKLVAEAIENGIEVISIPGPSAVITGLAASGLPTDQFYFAGFLPDKDGKRRKRLEDLKDISATLIFYVSKWKIKKVDSESYLAFLKLMQKEFFHIKWDNKSISLARAIDMYNYAVTQKVKDRKE